MVLKNVIENGLKYSEGSNKPVEINVIDKPEAIVLQIEDFGIGIPQEKLELLFEPFYRVDTSRSGKTCGYGLGLHLAKRIIDAHGAAIQIISKTSNHDSRGIAELSFPKQNNL